MSNKSLHLQERAKNIRAKIINMVTSAKSGHPGGALGLADVFAVLYFAKILRYNPNDAADPNRDILVLSNGHTCPVLYATLAEAGMITDEELASFRQFGSRLQGHPERTMLPWAEVTSGPLGEGLSQAAGMAYALKYLEPKNNRLVVCIVGDGEMNEGECWEALMFASKYKLNNLVIMIDNNRNQLSGATKDIMPLPDLDESIGGLLDDVYEYTNCDDITELMEDLSFRFDNARQGDTLGPTVMFLNTTMGKGVSFMENDYHWHGQAPTAEQAELALKDIKSGYTSVKPQSDDYDSSDYFDDDEDEDEEDCYD